MQANEYSVADRIVDVNAEYFLLVEKARQIASKQPPSKGEAVSETFTLVEGSNTFTRTIKDVPILRVDYQSDIGARFERMDEDQSRRINTWCYAGQVFFANEKQIFVENARVGTIRITYATGAVTGFTTADYALGTPPSPDFLPETFHPLLWLEPAATQAV